MPSFSPKGCMETTRHWQMDMLLMLWWTSQVVFQSLWIFPEWSCPVQKFRTTSSVTFVTPRKTRLWFCATWLWDIFVCLLFFHHISFFQTQCEKIISFAKDSFHGGPEGPSQRDTHVNNVLLQVSEREKGEIMDNGLVKGHGYGITDVRSVKVAKQLHKQLGRSTLQLVRIRNPWGIKEWNGAWSDE